MNTNLNIYKLLSICYGLLILPVPFIYPGDTTSLINISLPLLYFSYLHWIVSKNLVGLKREKIFVFFSITTLINFIVMALFGFVGSEGAGYMLLASLFILPVPVTLTLFFGLFSLFKSNRRMFYAFLLLIPVLLCIIFFVSSDLHRGSGSVILKLLKFLYTILLSPLWILDLI